MASDRDTSRDGLHGVLGQLPAFVAILRGPEHVFELANPAYLRLAGHRDLVGRPIREALPELAGQGLVGHLDGVYRTAAPYVSPEQPVRVRVTPEGPAEERFVNFVYQPLSDADGEVGGIIAHGVDVTELVRARGVAERQAAGLEAMTEELRNQATQLEETQAELEAANQDLAAASRNAEHSQARLEAVIRQMPSGIVVADAATGRIVIGNEQVDRIWRDRFDPARADAAERYAAFHADGRAYEQDEWPLVRALEGESVYGEQMSIKRADGTRGVISVSSAPVRDRDGSVVAAVAIFNDVTEAWQHEAEQAFLVEAARILASSLDYEETLKSVARLSVPRIADWCAVDVLEAGVTQRLAVVHEDPAKERLALLIEERWPSDPDSATGVPQVLRSGQPELYEEIPDEVLVAASHDEEHLRMLREVGLRSAMILPMVARGRTLGAITLIAAESGRRYGPSDLRGAEKLASRAAMAVDNARLYREAERVREEAEEARRTAEAANRAKSEFLANMSHEIRTPLNAVTGYTELLQMGIAGPITDEQRAHLTRIGKSSDHLLGLIDDLLDLARVESGRLEVRQHTLHAGEAVEAALALVGPQAARSRVALHNGCDGQADIAYVGDADRVRQILVNILGNAVKFTEPGGKVTVTCGRVTDPPDAPAQEPGPWTYIRIADSGIGIAADQLERIFRPFEQAEGGYTRQAGGAGLGLAISRQLALLMGGNVTATSVPNEGSEFTLWLPGDAPGDAIVPEAALVTRGNKGLARIGDAIVGAVDDILARYTARMRQDPVLPMATGLTEAELKDHHSSLLSDIAAALLVLGQASNAQAPLLRDGSEIQRVVADLHGRQRALLGWKEEALRREFDILREELRRTVFQAVDAEGEAVDLEGGLRIVDGLVERAERVSLRSFRAAASGRRHPP